MQEATSLAFTVTRTAESMDFSKTRQLVVRAGDEVPLLSLLETPVSLEASVGLRLRLHPVRGITSDARTFEHLNENGCEGAAPDNEEPPVVIALHPSRVDGSRRWE